MKQTNFVVEVVLTQTEPLIIIRDPRGNIVKVATHACDVTSFLEELIEKMETASSAN